MKQIKFINYREKLREYLISMKLYLVSLSTNSNMQKMVLLLAVREVCDIELTKNSKYWDR